MSSYRAHDGSPKSYDISPSRDLVATGAGDGVVRVWDAATMTLLHQLNVENQAQGVAFIGEDRVAVTPSGGGMLVFDLDPTVSWRRSGDRSSAAFTPEECDRFGFEDDLSDARGAARRRPLVEALASLARRRQSRRC